MMQKNNKFKSAHKTFSPSLVIPTLRASLCAGYSEGHQKAALYPALRHCGMTSGEVKGMTNAAHGFTLIELLVVVLIIGILAAVAVPQYQIAVGKTHFVNSVAIMETTIKAAQTYYLANGKFPDDKDSLDIQTPCLIWKNDKGTKDESFIISCNLYGNNTAYGRTTFYSLKQAERFCVANKNYPQTVVLCKKITGKQTPTTAISDLFLYQYENSNF